MFEILYHLMIVFFFFSLLSVYKCFAVVNYTRIQYISFLVVMKF